jgi:hypothetical protein
MKKKLAVLSLGAAISLFLAQGASAAPVTVGPFTTAYGLFDMGASSYDAATSTTTIVLDVSSFVAEFPSATPTPFLDRKFDTISFALTAAGNDRITKVSYEEGLHTVVAFAPPDFAYTASTGSAVVNNVSYGLGSFYQLTATAGTDFSLGTSFDIAGPETTVPASITNDILAFAFGDTATATVTKTYAALEVTTAPVPVPATLWLLGSAITGLAAMRRKEQGV